MPKMPLAPAIAEVKMWRTVSGNRPDALDANWVGETILRAVASGELVQMPEHTAAMSELLELRRQDLADHKLAVAEAYRKAAEIRVPGIVGMASLRPPAKAAILALADTDALAEVRALKTERDQGYRLLAHADRRADAAEAKVARLVEALTPSGDTKAEYSGEFSISVYDGTDDDGAELWRQVLVDWTTIKAIMATVFARAAISDIKGAKP